LSVTSSSRPFSNHRPVTKHRSPTPDIPHPNIGSSRHFRHRSPKHGHQHPACRSPTPLHQASVIQHRSPTPGYPASVIGHQTTTTLSFFLQLFPVTTSGKYQHLGDDHINGLRVRRIYQNPFFPKTSANRPRQSSSWNRANHRDLNVPHFIFGVGSSHSPGWSHLHWENSLLASKGFQHLLAYMPTGRTLLLLPNYPTQLHQTSTSITINQCQGHIHGSRKDSKFLKFLGIAWQKALPLVPEPI